MSIITAILMALQLSGWFNDKPEFDQKNADAIYSHHTYTENADGSVNIDLDANHFITNDEGVVVCNPDVG